MAPLFYLIRRCIFEFAWEACKYCPEFEDEFVDDAYSAGELGESE